MGGVFVFFVLIGYHTGYRKARGQACPYAPILRYIT